MVADQLRSLGPVGMLLSGGLDSTSVAAAAAPLLAKRGERLAAFTGAPMIGFREPDLPGWVLDEAPLAGEVAARHRNVDHLVVRAQGLFLDDLDRFFDAAEMPYTGTASRVWYEGIMAAAQRRDISVLLTGKCGNYTVSWPGTGLIRSLVGKGHSRQAWLEARAQAPDGGMRVHRPDIRARRAGRAAARARPARDHQPPLRRSAAEPRGLVVAAVADQSRVRPRAAGGRAQPRPGLRPLAAAPGRHARRPAPPPDG